ncbi:hypothetical protein HBI62_012890 [Parastagonospora nodorum]|nr:hypothetical protein HBI95_020810 [Parastagonospora nodorum]KAH5236110.1 hypothetical protein HBI62_012890 [Parastagonospora nodorum]KAH5280698.1 hypothetical protein HBI72_023580 [Parastagonospora nodorum]KAH6169142.1 hypothetical protein HBI63_003810 [Parastagonospora nodorum]KAH6190484.1 hypothetical protein HBI61_012880 [Parastagonospora nodorum]
MTQTSVGTNCISRRYRLLLRPSMPPMARTVLLSLYDLFLIFILIAHITTYRTLITPVENFCDSKDVISYPDSDLPPSTTVRVALGFRVPSMAERCQRYSWSTTAAGGFSSTIAAMLAAAHVATVISRVAGLCSTWTNEARESRKVKEGGKLDEQENKWHVTPRDVDIHNRGTVRSGRLTVISEEEYNSCGDAVRRRRGNKSKSSESGRSKATSGGTKKVEQTLLECLVA